MKVEYFLDRETRARWGRGPWDDEPDRVEWRYRSLPCLIVRNRMGALCGYVGLPPGHPMHGVDYDGVRVAPDEDGDTWPSVNGGLTYANRCQGEGGHICHVAEPGEPDDVWWLGFDCAHSHDLTPCEAPGSENHRRYGGGGEFFATYKTVEFVRRETERLADQLLREPAK